MDIVRGEIPLSVDVVVFELSVVELAVELGGVAGVECVWSQSGGSVGNASS